MRLTGNPSLCGTRCMEDGVKTIGWSRRSSRANRDLSLGGVLLLTLLLASPSIRAASLEDEINGYLETQQFESAVGKLEALFAKNSREAETIRLLGRVYGAWWESSSRSQAGEVPAGEYAEHIRQRMKKSLNFYAEAIRLRPSDVGTRLEYANFLRVTGSHALVLQQIEEMLNFPLEGDLLQSLLAMADSYTDESKFKYAAGIYKILSKLDPSNEALKANYGICLIRSTRPAEGIEILQQARQLDANDDYAARNLFQTQCLLGQLDAAKATAAELIKLNPKEPEALFDRALVLAVLQDPGAGEAVDAYLKASEGVLSEASFRPRAETLKSIIGKKGDAAHDSLEGLMTFFDEADANHFVVLLSKLDDALGSPRLSNAERRLKTYQRLKFADQEWNSFMECRELADQDAQLTEYYRGNKAMFSIGRDYFHSDYPEVALDMWSRCIQQGNDDAKIQLHMGRAYYDMGQLEKAREHFTHASQRQEPAVDRLKAKGWIKKMDEGRDDSEHEH